MAERDELGVARAAAWVAIAVSVPIVVFLIGSNAVIAVPEARIAVHVLLVLAGAAWVLASARGAALPSLVIWLLPLMAALGVSTITSVRPGPSREALALWRTVAVLSAVASMVVLAFTQPDGGLLIVPRLLVAVVVEVVLIREFIMGRTA